jgi:hypothetical protein
MISIIYAIHIHSAKIVLISSLCHDYFWSRSIANVEALAQ